VTTGQLSLDDASPALSNVVFCVLDLETAGSSAEVGGITEIGAVKYQGGQEIARFTTLVNPGCAIPSFIVMLTGITDIMVMNAPPIEDVLDDLVAFIGDSVIVAHNARFDMSFIQSSLERDGRPRLTNKVIDTVSLARRLVRSEVPNCKLSTLAESLGLRHQPAHRAINDVLATGDLLHYLIERAAGFGVFDLSDLIALPKLGAHPQARKLKFTEQLPRTTGVYMFTDVQGEVLYVGKASNIRSRVRSYFGTNESRTKVGSLLKLMQGVEYIQTPDILTAEILELRIIGRLRPRYNHAGTRTAKYCYVRLTLDEEWPRLLVSKTPSAKGLCIGPISTRNMATEVVDAIESVIPLRRCTVRMGRKYVAPEGAPVCSAARLGLAQCPCSGTADPESYANVVRLAADALTGNSAFVLDALTERMNSHSEAQRYEEAAYLRDRIQTFNTVMRRYNQAVQLCERGSFSLRFNNIVYEIDHGVLASTRYADQMFTPLDGVSQTVRDAIIPPQSASNEFGALRNDVIDEVLCIAKFLEAQK
jgi:DNA polymerase-3 subunit epsilon